MNSIYQNIITLLQKYQIPYGEFDHDPILNYDDAEREKKRFGWIGIESKNVFMAGNDGKYYLYVTIMGQKVDFKKLKELLGVKLSIASEDDVRNVINCVPGCVSPFGFDESIVILIDQTIWQYNEYLFSPGVTTKTIQTSIQDLKQIFENLPNTVINII